jgi:hypothetical protein
MKKRRSEGGEGGVVGVDVQHAYPHSFAFKGESARLCIGIKILN